MALGKRRGQSSGDARRRRRLNQPTVEHFNVPNSDEEAEASPSAPPAGQLITNWEIRGDRISTTHNVIVIPSSPDASPTPHQSALLEHDDPPLRTFDIDEYGEMAIPDYSSFLEELSEPVHRVRTSSVGHPHFTS